MNNQPTQNNDRIHVLKIAGPIIVIALVILVVVLAPRLFKKKDYGANPISTRHERINALDDRALAGKQKALPASFALPITLKTEGGKDVGDRWEAFEFFGDPSFAPLHPKVIVENLSQKKELTRSEFQRLLDSALRSDSVKGAVAICEKQVNKHPKDPMMREVAARFFENRLMPEKAIKQWEGRFEALYGLLPETLDNEKIEIADKAAEALNNVDRIGEAYGIKVSTEGLLKRLILACPNHPSLLFDYVDKLFEKKKFKQAEKFLSKYNGQVKDVARLVQYKAKALEGQEKVDAALALYEKHPDFLKDDSDLFGDYLSLLSRNHLTEQWRKELADRLDDELDMDAFTKLFMYFERQSDSKLVVELLNTGQKLLVEKGANRKQLAQIADLCTRYPEDEISAREVTYRWNLWITAKDEADKQTQAVALAKALTRTDQKPSIPLGGALSGGARPQFLDRYPGVVGGVISLDLNTRGTRERFEELGPAGHKYENMRLALRLAAPYLSKDASDDLAGEAVQVIASTYRRLDNRKLSAKILNDFIDDHPNAKAVPDVLWKLADYYRYEKEYDREIAIYKQVMQVAKKREKPGLLVQGRKRIVSRLIALKRFDAVIPFYWEQVNKDKRDEALLLEFISFCRNNNIFEEAVKAYEVALRRFDKSEYGDKLASYLLRYKRRQAFEDLTTSLAQTLEQGDLESYLRRHVRVYKTFDSAENRFYERMYIQGLSRFPESRGMLFALLGFYERFEKKNKTARLNRTDLLMRFFSVYPSLGRALCTELSAQGKLYAALDEMIDEKELNPIQMRFVAEALGFVSRFEAQYHVKKMLAQAYPETNLIEQTASLERSLGSSFYARDEKLTEASAKHYQSLATLYPTKEQYATLAGEVYVEAGKQQSAAKAWEQLLRIEPKKEQAYLDLATLYWDYYLFNHALGVIDQAQEEMDAPLALAKEKAYIYESMGEIDPALEEYAKLICNQDDLDWEVSARVHKLEQDEDLKPKLTKAFDDILDSSHATYRFVLNYGQYLSNWGEQERKTEIYKRYLDSFKDEEFLIALADYFGGMGMGDYAQICLERLADVSGRTTDVLLRLAAFYENNQKFPNLHQLCNELEEKNGPGSLRYEAILSRVTAMRWESGEKGKALAGYKQLAEIAKGYEKDRRLFQYGQKCLAAGHEKEGVETLFQLYKAHPERAHYLTAVADYYGEKNDYPELAKLYKEALDFVKKSDMSSYNKEDLLRTHRLALIDTLKRMDKNTEALDQYIEILNQDAPDEPLLDDIYRFAQSANIVGRVEKYYVKLAEKSHKDYRWQWVLGQLYDRMGKLKESADEYVKAIRNEPQRLELYDLWVRELKRQGDDKGVVAALERKYAISGTVDDLRRMAEAAFSAGERQRAIDLLDGLTKDSGTPVWRLFEVARIFVKNNENDRATALINRAVAAFKADPLKSSISRPDLMTVANMVADNEGYVQAITLLDNLHRWLMQKGKNAKGLSRNRLYRKAGDVKNALITDFAYRLYRFATVEELSQTQKLLEEKMVEELTRSALSSMGKSTFDKHYNYYKQFAENAQLVNLRLEALKRRMEAYHLYASDYRMRGHFRNAVMDYVNALRPQNRPEEVVAILQKFDFSGGRQLVYFELLADFAQMAKDKTSEQKALAGYYRIGKTTSFQKGDLMRIRYLDWLAKNDFATLDNLAHRTSHPGQYVSWATYHKQEALALAALKSHFKTKPISWHLRRKAQIFDYLKLDDSLESSYEQMLGLPRNIGQIETRDLDQNVELTRGRWYEWGQKYGEFLLDRNSKEAEAFLLSGAEKSPKSASPYLRLARVYSEAKQFDKAWKAMDLAEALSKDNASIIIEARGNIYLLEGKKGKAKKEYEKLIAKGSESLDTYRTYYRLMKNAEMGKQALDKFKEVLSRRFASLAQHSKIWEMSLLVAEEKDPVARAKYFRSLVELNTPDTLAVIDGIVREPMLPKQQLGWFIEKGADFVHNSTKFTRYTKIDRQKKVLEHALRMKDLNMGERAIQNIFNLDSDQMASYIVMARAKLALACKKGEEGARPILGMADAAQTRHGISRLIPIAKKFGRDDVAQTLRYKELILADKTDDISTKERVELAQLYYEHKEADKAKSQLEYAATQSVGSPLSLEDICWGYIAIHDSKGALPHVDTLLRIDKKTGAGHLAKAVALTLANDVETGVAYFDEIPSGQVIARDKIASLFEKAADAFKAAGKTDQLAAGLGQSESMIAHLLAAYILVENDSAEKALQHLDAIATPYRYERLVVDLYAKAYAQRKDYRRQIDTLDRAIALSPKQSGNRADRFFAYVNWGKSLQALYCIEGLLPTKLYKLMTPVSTSASVYNAKTLPGRFGLTGEKGQSMLKAIAKIFEDLGHLGEARIYWNAVAENADEKADISAADKQVDRLTKLIEEKQKQIPLWPRITSER